MFLIYKFIPSLGLNIETLPDIDLQSLGLNIEDFVSGLPRDMVGVGS